MWILRSWLVIHTRWIASVIVGHLFLSKQSLLLFSSSREPQGFAKRLCALIAHSVTFEQRRALWRRCHLNMLP